MSFAHIRGLVSDELIMLNCSAMHFTLKLKVTILQRLIRLTL